MKYIYRKRDSRVSAFSRTKIRALTHLSGRVLQALKSHGNSPKWKRWTDSEMEDVAQRLKEKDPKDYGIDEWMMSIDLLLHHNLPCDTTISESEYAAVRRVIRSKLQYAQSNADTGLASYASEHDSKADSYQGPLDKFDDRDEAFIASLPYGTRVKRFEAYAGACEFCQSIRGRIFTVVSPDKPDKDGETEIWLGKTSVDFNPGAREGDDCKSAVHSSGEKRWVAVGAQHAGCRGSWMRIRETPPNVDPGFEAWLNKTLEQGIDDA